MSRHLHVTVAAIVERDGRFLVVEEETMDGLRINQPAGHLESDESIPDGVVRETIEESGYRVTPECVVGIYRWAPPGRDLVYVRFALAARVTGHDPHRPLDKGILRALWLTRTELQACSERHRSPLVMRCVTDYLAGHRHPLDLLVNQP
ncbi:MAG: NUDIX hydrolase [Burkholderiales bacterium]